MTPKHSGSPSPGLPVREDESSAAAGNGDRPAECARPAECERPAECDRPAEHVAPETCPSPGVTRTQELIDNLPYLIMVLSGAAIGWTMLGGGAWGGLTAGFYFLYGLIGALWIMFFICPYCHFYDTRLCPCGYGQIAGKLRAKQAGDDFSRQFRKHIPVIVPLWFAPPIASAFGLLRHFSWPLAALLAVFVINSFVILPLVSRMYGCARCPQKQTCPWMGGCKGT